MSRREDLRRALEALRAGTSLVDRVPRDPVVFPRRFHNPRDIEVVGWIASSLAYGRVPLFQAAMEKTLAVMGESPSLYAERFDPKKDVRDFESAYYRMSGGRDIACLIYLIGRVLARRGSVGAFFQSLYRESDPDIGPALERFVREALLIDTSPVYGRRSHPYGLRFFLPLPSKGSACKRLNLYLRWMVRPADGLDFGLWKAIPPAKLVIPLDTHVLRIGRYLGLTRRRTGDWRAAKEITEALKRFDPEDPLKYDFALCHHGISGNCPIGRAPQKCEVCPLLPFCAKGRKLVPAATLP